MIDDLPMDACKNQLSIINYQSSISPQFAFAPFISYALE